MTCLFIYNCKSYCLCLSMKLCYILIVYLVVKRSIAFVINNNVSRKGKETKVNGFLDDWKLTFSEEGKKNRKAYNEGERAKQEEAQREIMERRNNPQKMAEYEQRVSAKRQKLQEDRQVWDFQTKAVDDPINDWNRLRKEGKIKVGSDLERDPSSSRLGSEGLVDVRIDELMPYIDQGYVDEDADIMKNFMNLFGGGKKKK